MKSVRQNLMSMRTDAICITTNGCFKANGDGVMGRGVAFEAKRKWPGIERVLGTRNKALGGKTCLLTCVLESGSIYLPGTSHYNLPYHIISFITKHGNDTDRSLLLPQYENGFIGDETVPGWACKSSLGLITTSLQDLIQITNDAGFKSVALPQPGCGNGGLSWDLVGPILEKVLDDRFIVVNLN